MLTENQATVSVSITVFRTWVTTSWVPEFGAVVHCIFIAHMHMHCNHTHMHCTCTYICTALAYTCIHICIALAYAHIALAYAHIALAYARIALAYARIALALEGQTAKRRETTGTSCVQFQQICSQAAMFYTARRVCCQLATRIAKHIKLHMQQPLVCVRFGLIRCKPAVVFSSGLAGLNDCTSPD